MFNFTIQQKLYHTLRFAIAMCFIGHGAFGIITKPIWCNYFAVFGIGKDAAYQFMPWIGAFDILCGIVILIYPIRIIPLWLVLWGSFTALLRPLSGEPFAELIERAGNFGAPLALLLLCGGFKINLKSLFSKLEPVDLNPQTIKTCAFCLQVVVCLLLAGHGWLNLIEKNALIAQYTALGISNPLTVAHLTGIAEMAAAVIVLIKPAPPLLFVFFLWKITSELFYPHWEAFEWIERGGSYGCILALWFIVRESVRGPYAQVSVRIFG